MAHPVRVKKGNKRTVTVCVFQCKACSPSLMRLPLREARVLTFCDVSVSNLTVGAVNSPSSILQDRGAGCSTTS